MPNLKSIVYIPVVDFGEVVLLVVVTGGKQSQLLVRLTWTGMDLDWSLTIVTLSNHSLCSIEASAQCAFV